MTFFTQHPELRLPWLAAPEYGLLRVSSEYLAPSVAAGQLDAKDYIRSIYFPDQS